MRASRLLAALAVALAAGGAWMLLAEHETETPRPIHSPATDDVTELDDLVVRTAGAGSDADGSDGGERDEFGRVEVADDADAGDDAAAEGLEVLVLDGEVPVPDAEVFWGDENELERRGREADLSRRTHDGALAARFGARAVTGSDGRVSLPPVAMREPELAARKGELFGVGERRRGSRDVVIRLQRDETLTIDVVRPDGEPLAGAPVAVVQSGGRRPDFLWSEAADERGRIVIEHFQLYRNDSRRGGERTSALLRIPGPVMVAKDFPDPAPAEPLILEAPATTSLTVSVVDAQGLPVRAPLAISLTPAEGEREQAGLASWFTSASETKDSGDTEVLFPFVATATRLSPRVRFVDDRDHAWTGVEITTPRTPDSEAQVEVATPDWLTLLEGRLLDADEAPLSRQTIDFIVRAGNRPVERERLRTFDDGIFELALRADRPEFVAPYELEVRDEVRDDDPQGVDVGLAGLPPGDRVRLGDLMLRVLPPIARGLVVDDLGEPIRGADVQLEAFRTLAGEGAETRWLDENQVDDRTDDEGRFALHGDRSGLGRVRLRVARRGHESVYVESFDGQRDVRVMLQRHGALMTRFTVPEWLPDEVLQLRITSRDPEVQPRQEDVDRRGNFGVAMVDEMRPGLYDVALLLRGFDDPVAEVGSVSVMPGIRPPTRDPRLDAIDLANTLFRYRFEGVRQDGSTHSDLSGAVVAKLPGPDGSPQWTAFSWRGNSAEIITFERNLEVFALSDGRPPQRLLAVPGTTQVVLPDLHPAELLLPGLRELVGGRRVRVSMVFQGDTGLPSSLRAYDQRSGRSFTLSRAMLSKSGGAWLGDDPLVRVPLHRNGRFDVVARIYPENGRGGPESRKVGEVDVILDGVAPQRDTVPIDPAVVRDALQALDTRGR